MIDINAFQTATRLGFAARGLTYIAIGYLVLRLGRTEDHHGALAFIESAGGEILLLAMALGFLAYGIWRLSEAFVDGEGHGSDAKGMVVRIGGAVSGLIHIALAWAAVGLANGDPQGHMSPSEQGASTALDWPGGVYAVWLLAAILVGVGAFQIVKAIKLTFLTQVEPRAARQPWVAWAGRIGYLARGIVFLAMALFMARAADQHRPGAAGDIDQALDAFPPALRAAVALGLILFGLFSLVEAIYRRITDPDVIRRLRRAVA